MDTKSTIYNLIINNIDCTKIDVIDDSYKHANHKKDTRGGHYRLLIVSDDFKNISLINRHKLIYKILDKLMKVKIHALSMQILTKEEYHSKL